jgi:hypothetical protein
LIKNLNNKKINLFIILDNCSSHPHISLENIELLFLSQNTSSRLQAIDAGIIRSFKQRYRNKILEFFIEDNHLLDVIKHLILLKAIYFIHSSIKEIPNSVFINCFKECGVAFDFVQNENNNDSNDDLFVENNWISINHRLELGFENYEEIVCNLSDTEIEDNHN